MIIWLTSYPKSGNTLLRLLLSNYLFGDSSNSNPLISLKKIKKFPDKLLFDHLINSQTNGAYLSDDDLLELNYRNWINCQELMIKKEKNIFLKTHNVYCSIDESIKFTNSKITKAFIYVVRDPRNVILSYANHMSYDQEKSYSRIINSSSGKVSENVFEVYGSWETHYLSWKKFTEVPSLFIKYEDLIIDTENELLKILTFLSDFVDINILQKKIEKVVNLNKFNNLKNIEKNFGFAEAVNKNIFFHKGPQRNWEKELKKEFSDGISRKFNKVMKDLNYI